MQHSFAVPVCCMQGCIVIGLMALEGGKWGGAPEMGAGPLVFQPVGKVRCPVLTVEVCP